MYADSSFLVSLYIQDVHSPAARQRMTVSPLLWFTPLHWAECFHAIAQQAFRRRIPVVDAEAVYANLNRDQRAGIWLETPIPEMAFTLCADLARRYGARLGVRTLDSLQVACALELKAERFWTFDKRPAKLARVQGLKTN